MNKRTFAVGILALVACAATLYFHGVVGTDIIFPHLYYLPIILAAIWWERRSWFLTAFLCAFLLAAHVISGIEMSITADLARATSFLFVGGVVAELSRARRQAGEALLQASYRHQAVILESMLDAVIVVNPDGAIRTLNRAALELLGYAEEEIIGQPVGTIFEEEEEEEEEEEAFFRGSGLAQLVREGAARDVEMTLVTRSGERIPVMFNGSVIHDDEGHLRAVLGVARDMRQIMGLMEEAQRRAEELAALNAIAEAVSGSLDLDEVLGGALDETLKVLELDAGAIRLADEEREELVLAVYSGMPEGLTQRIARTPMREGVAGRVVQTGKVEVGDFADYDAAYPAMVDRYGRKPFPFACIPLKARDRVVGVMTVAHTEPRQFTAQDMQLLAAIGDQMGVAIENARLYEETRRRALEQETLREAALALTTALDRNEVIERILAQLQQVVPYDSASVQLLREDRMELVGGRGFPNLPDLRGISFPADGDNPNSEVIRTRASFIVEDAPTVYEGFREDPHRQAVIRSWLGVPMLIGEQLVGMIALDKCEPGFYTQGHARLAEAFAAQAAVAFENARLFEEIEERRLYLEGVLGAAPDAVVTLDAHHRVVEWNAGAERLFGYSREEVIGQNLDDLVTSPDVFEEAVEFTQIVMGGKEVPPTESVRYRKDGSPVDVIVAGSPILVGDEFIGLVAVYTDITARVRMEETLRALALIDDLTNLYNRRGFSILAEQQLKMAHRGKRRMMLLFADFDGLKQINDAFGHSEGDRALIETADVLRETFRESDIIARIGGDEFVVLAIETNRSPAEILARRLQENLEARNARGDRRYELSLSVGLARYNPEHPCSIDELLAQADRAMYERKRGNEPDYVLESIAELVRDRTTHPPG